MTVKHKMIKSWIILFKTAIFKVKLFKWDFLYKNHYSFAAFKWLFGHQVMSDSFMTPWTVAHQVPLSMEFPRPKYWSGLLFPPLGHLPDSRSEPTSLPSPALADGFFTTEPPAFKLYKISLSKISLVPQMKGLMYLELFSWFACWFSF